MSNPSIEAVEIFVQDRASMDRTINEAVDQMIKRALHKQTYGVLVTRLANDHFTVGLSATVPFGYTEQFDSRPRRPLLGR